MPISSSYFSTPTNSSRFTSSRQSGTSSSVQTSRGSNSSSPTSLLTSGNGQSNVADISSLAGNLLQQIGSSQSGTSVIHDTSSTSSSTTPATADSSMTTSTSATPALRSTTMGATFSSTPTVALTTAETSILQSTYMSDSRGIPVTGNSLAVQDLNSDGRLSVGDNLVVSDSTGNAVTQKSLTSTDMYDVLFRENVLKNISAIGNGWSFTSRLVGISNNELSRPYYRNSNGTWENVTARNNYWEVVNRGGRNYLMMRQTDNSGNPVKASDALTDLFKNKQNYMFDCATPMTVLNLKSTLDTIGADDFNSKAGRLVLSSWFDPYDTSRSDGGFVAKVRTAPANTITVNGVSNLSGETAPFDPNLGDKLIPGGGYYFDKPGDMTSANQGWNAIYLGKTNTGYQFWSSGIGVVNINFNNNSWIASTGYNGYYLGASVTSSNTSRLQAWDVHNSL